MLTHSLASSWWLIAISISSGVFGQTLIKLGVDRPGAESDVSGLFSVILLILRSPFVFGGLVLYGIGALAWIAVLDRLDLSYAYPFLALNFILIAVVSRLLLDEIVPTARWLGLGFICVGILIVARTGMSN